MKQAIEKKEEEYIGSEFLEPINKELSDVENKLHSNAPDANNLLSEIITYILKAGGKRIRPAFSLLLAKGTGEITEKHIILAELTELIHTASLIHDDIIDSASIRRGTETLHTLWNDKISVIVGDYLFAQASVRLGELENNEIVKIYAKVLSDLCSGEIEQYANKFKINISWEYYIHKSHSKTASLFAAACQCSAMLNNLNKIEIEQANNFGKYIGIAFQIKDDLLDFTSTTKKLGKNLFSDLKEGIITAPTLFALNSNDKRSEELKKLIESRFNNSEKSFDEAIRLVFELGGIEKAHELAQKYINDATSNLGFVKNQIFKKHLENAANFIIKRD